MKIPVLIATFHRNSVLLVRGVVRLGANVEIVFVPGHLEAVRHQSGCASFSASHGRRRTSIPSTLSSLPRTVALGIPSTRRDYHQR